MSVYEATKRGDHNHNSRNATSVPDYISTAIGDIRQFFQGLAACVRRRHVLRLGGVCPLPWALKKRDSLVDSYLSIGFEQIRVDAYLLAHSVQDFEHVPALLCYAIHGGSVNLELINGSDRSHD